VNVQDSKHGGVSREYARGESGEITTYRIPDGSVGRLYDARVKGGRANIQKENGGVN